MGPKKTSTQTEPQPIVSELQYIRNVLTEMNSIPKEKPTIYCDNQACIRLAKEGRSKRAKHIEIKFLHVKENLEKGMFTLDYIGTDEMIADMMTKALGQPKLEKFRSAVCITDQYSQPIEGGC